MLVVRTCRMWLYLITLVSLAAFKQYGVAAAKSEAKAAQQSAIAGSCACPANAPIVAVMQELSDLYFKEGNANAGASVSFVRSGLLASLVWVCISLCPLFTIVVQEGRGCAHGGGVRNHR